MPRIARKRRKNGAQNGQQSAFQPAAHKNGAMRITIIDYDKGTVQEKEVKSVEECFPFRDKPTATWIKIDGLHQPEQIEKLGRHFKLHPVIVDDLTSAEQRPRMENFGDYLFVILKLLYYNETEMRLSAEHVGLILGKNFVISLQEGDGAVFNPVRERIRNERSLLREKGADYLMYALLDTIVDSYFVILEKLGDDIDELEEKLVKTPKPATSRAINSIKQELVFFRKSVWPLREVISGLEIGDSPLIKDMRIYFRDVYDHTAQVIDTVEIYREMLSGMVDIYLSSLSNKMNEIMKVLTIIATIFIPLTFIVGLYGMNFRYMPELEWQYGYPLVLAAMALVGIGMLAYFRKRKWF